MKEKVKSILQSVSFDKWVLLSSILIFILLFNYLFNVELKITPNSILKQKSASPSESNSKPNQVIEQNVIPSQVKLPVKWGDFGKQLVDTGVIDKNKFEDIMGTLPDEDRKLLEESNNNEIVMTEQNSRLILNLLWAFGLGNKNDVLDKGDISKVPEKTGNFASTGGWNVSVGSSMNHFSKHNLLTLTEKQQAMVEDMSKNIFRPCCNNPTYFPDCNHGMAMLGLLELMAANDVSEEEAYKIALQVNSMWFPQTYQELAVYFAENGTSWDKVNAKEALGPEYSSVTGYRNTRAQIKSLPQPTQGGGGCGL